jgi:hypothetical protein
MKNERMQIQPVIQSDQSGTGFANYQGNGMATARSECCAEFVGHAGKMSPASVVVAASTEKCWPFF